MGDVQSLRSFVDGVLLQGLIMLISLALYLVYMLRTSATLTLACLGLSPVLAFSEGIHGMLVLKVFGREPDEHARFRERNRAVLEQQKSIFRRVSRYS